MSTTPQGQRVSTSVSYQGLEYLGEVLVTPGWDPALGEPLQGDRFFRIVFLQEFLAIDPRQLRDARIAVCLPPASVRQRGRVVEMERRVLRELRARYGQPEVAQALLEIQRQLYASGTVATRAAIDIPPRAVFQGTSPEEWISSMAQALLAWTYPGKAIDSSTFPRALRAEDASLLFRGIVQGDVAPEVMAVLEALAFGVGLGLMPAAESGGPGIPEPRPFRIIRSELAQHGGAWSSAELYRTLAHVHGLPYPLVSLYLLAFVQRSQPPVELHLRRGHGLRLRDGRPYQGLVVVAETTPSLDFAPRLDQETRLVRYTVPASWNTLCLYFSSLEPSLVPQEEGERVPTAPFMETLTALRGDVRRLEKAAERLALALGEEVPRETQGLLEEFRRLGRASSPDDALQIARRLFESPQGLAQAVARYRALRHVAGEYRLLGSARRYLLEAHVPEEMPELALQRQALQASLRMGELATAPGSLSLVQEQIARFREVYGRAYARHHRDYHRTAASLLTSMRDAEGDANALQRLNSIVELGEPVGLEWLEGFRRLRDELVPCSVSPSRLALGRSARCRQCRLALGQMPPLGQVVQAIQDVQRGLREQTHRLSALAVQRALSGPADEPMARFIQMVAASNVAGLVQVLDDQMVSFLREVLRGS